MKAIIFDFNRTIYDPEINKVDNNAEMLLHKLREREFILFLISRGGKERKNFINNLDIKKNFKEIIVSNEKSEADFIKIIKNNKINPKLSFVIGDQVKREITFGNKLGFKTIWLKKGKFSNIKPQKKVEQPNNIVKKLDDILKLAH